MDTYIVRQPIINNRTQKIAAYEMVYQQDSSVLYNKEDSGIAAAIISFFNQIDEESVLNDKKAFLTFTPNLLMKNVPKIFDEKKLIIQIEDNLLVNPDAVEILKQYKDRGYEMAVIGFEFYNRYLDILPDVEYIKIDFSEPGKDRKAVRKIVELARRLGKSTIAYNVNTPEARGKALVYGFDYIQGESIAEMMRTKVHKPEKLNSTFFRLLSAISRRQPDFNEIEKIISVDVSLTFSLFKMVNSAYFSLPNRVKDVKLALTTLGMQQLKNWIYLMSFVPDGGMSEELVKVSFMRATFCQKIVETMPKFPIDSDAAYLLGMFSTLDALLEVSMSEALKQLPLPQDLSDGLLGRPGPCNDLLQICTAYEKGRWTKVSRYSETLGVPVHIIAQNYFDALEHVSNIWASLMRSAPNGK
ncbi:EAL and HDOD domain-containing protein [Acidaminobacterium chupaoyuni]